MNTRTSDPDRDDSKRDSGKTDDADTKPPHGQGHQPLPGETSPHGVGAQRKHVQNADLPPGQGHQTLPGEDPPSKRGDRDD
ncbi:hypothetical protein [Lysobacter enzymogenes]|uniref:hypothetical protein n=1 Tax=Lysobacter enzymogenes TaxID=69 RepID=UPI0008970B7C|nr:hypothetical protein [Lysobacter enzymogenes]SDX20955.1 hypothetical protein SAMN05421681_104225 [Lysobacter enzymogenes]